MGKKIEAMDYDVDMNFDPKVISEKFPHQMGGASPKEMSDFHEIPCDRLEVFKNKQVGDFSNWEEGKFQELKDSIAEHGVIEPITVRPITGSNRFEILAGEHRWKASQALGLPSVPARVRSGCDDDEAIAIFSLTNVMRRDTTLKDRAFGCWLYTNKTKYKTATKIRDLVKQGILKEEELSEPLGRTQLYRYSKIHELPTDLFALIENNIVDLKTGARLGLLDKDQQEDLSPYSDAIKSSAVANKIVDLAQGKLEGLSWEDDTIFALINGKKGKEKVVNPNSLSYASQQAKIIIKERIPKEMYGMTDKIISEALSLYFEKYGIEGEG